MTSSSSVSFHRVVHEQWMKTPTGGRLARLAVVPLLHECGGGGIGGGGGGGGAEDSSSWSCLTFARRATISARRSSFPFARCASFLFEVPLGTMV